MPTKTQICCRFLSPSCDLLRHWKWPEGRDTVNEIVKRNLVVCVVEKYWINSFTSDAGSALFFCLLSQRIKGDTQYRFTLWSFCCDNLCTISWEGDFSCLVSSAQDGSPSEIIVHIWLASQMSKTDAFQNWTRQWNLVTVERNLSLCNVNPIPAKLL